MRLSTTAAAALLGVIQAVPGRTLPPASLEFREGFTGISAIRELSDGRVLVLDRADKAVRLVDLSRGVAMPVGRQGGGPGEYKSPSRLIPLGGDSTLLVDPGLQRSILIGPDGVAGDVLLDARQLGSAPSGARTPLAADRLGGLYYLGGTLGADPGAELPDSVSVLRLDRKSGRVDTLARIRQAKAKILVGREGTRITSVNIRKVPFVPHDDWTVSPDGRLIIVRTDAYRVDQQSAPGGALLLGPRIAYAPISVVDADRGSAIDPLPKYKPPFEGPSTSVAPDGRVWVRRTTAASDSTARYDVFDGSGRLLSRVALPARTRLAGFGRATLYVVRRDEDDLEYLGREPLPVT